MNIFKNMQLGIVIRDGEKINHRSFIKVVFNPIFKRFGFHIGTILKNNKELGGICIVRIEKQKIHWEKYDVQHDFIIKRRRFI